MPPPHLSAEHVETKLRGLALLNRVRVSEFFKDFDPLRSGKITSMHAHKHYPLVLIILFFTGGNLDSHKFNYFAIT